MNMTYIDCDELTLRIAEACMGNRRPVGMSAPAALKQLQGLNTDAHAGFQRAALAAANYIAECCNETYPGSVEVKQITVETRATQ